MAVKITIILLLILFIFTIVKSIVRLIQVNIFLKKTLQIESAKIELDEIKGQKIQIIMPVYREVGLIEEAMQYFMQLDSFCDVHFVTSSKEEDNATLLEVEHFINVLKPKNIFASNCPQKFGTMATQVNYVAKTLPYNSIIGIYNIDSKPQKQTFPYVLKHISEGKVYQQVSYFNDPLKGIMESAQDWQNRWSVCYEIGKMIKKSGGLNFVYTIGHGFFAMKSDLEKYGYWSDEIINEDNELGFRLLCAGVQIKPIPFMEKASFARDTKIYVKQQSTWFNGPLYAFSYNSHIKKQGKKSSLLLALLNFKTAVSWLLFPYISLFSIIFGFIFSWPFGIAFLLLTLIYVTGINWGASQILHRHGFTHKKRLIHPIYDFAFFFVHTFGPIKTLFKLMRRKNTIANKYKTEK